jgi:hypothetical protein
MSTWIPSKQWKSKGKAKHFGKASEMKVKRLEKSWKAKSKGKAK